MVRPGLVIGEVGQQTQESAQLFPYSEVFWVELRLPLSPYCDFYSLLGEEPFSNLD